MTHKYEVGDWVKWLGIRGYSGEDLTIGKTYKVIEVADTHLYVSDDVGDEHSQNFEHWSPALAPVSQTPVTIRASVVYYPQTGRYTVYGTNEQESTDMVIADLVHDIEGHGPYVIFKLESEVVLPETRVYKGVLTPFEGENYD